MKIESTSGHIFQIDEEDWAVMPKTGWYVRKHRTGTFYMQRDYQRTPRITLPMHSVVMNVPRGVTIDHINGDSLDNRKLNLRICSNAQNACNKGNYKNSISKYKSVSPTYQGKWRAQIQRNGIKIYIGTYKTELEAAYNYNLCALDIHGEFARLNDLTT